MHARSCPGGIPPGVVCKSLTSPYDLPEMAEDRAPDIRGVLRTELICDLALGELTHVELAEKYGRSTQAINSFSSRNKDEIRRAKQDQASEWAGNFSAKKKNRVSGLEQCLRDIEDAFADPSLSHSQRNRYINTVAKLYRNIAEELGELRTQLELDVPKHVSEVVGWNIADWAMGHAGKPDGRTAPAPFSNDHERPITPALAASEPEPASPPVSPDVEQGATHLAMQVWAGKRSPDQIFPGA
jgi:hypothetical protein